jgi:predicted LPLAT superfamily acyltransferase
MTSANHAGRHYVSRISKRHSQHTVLIHLQHMFTFIRSHVTSMTSEYGNGRVQHTAKSEVFTTR